MYQTLLSLQKLCFVVRTYSTVPCFQIADARENMSDKNSYANPVNIIRIVNEIQIKYYENGVCWGEGETQKQETRDRELQL